LLRPVILPTVAFQILELRGFQTPSKNNVLSFYEAITALCGTFTCSKVNFELKFGRHFVLSFSSGVSKIFEDFVPRDPAFARVFSRRAAVLKIVEKALGTRLGEGPEVEALSNRVHLIK